MNKNLLSILIIFVLNSFVSYGLICSVGDVSIFDNDTTTYTSTYWNITGSEGLVNDSGILDVNTTYIQRRLTNCTTGTAAQNFSGDGTTECISLSSTGAWSTNETDIYQTNQSLNVSVNGTIRWNEKTGVQTLWYLNPWEMDGFAMMYFYNFEAANDDWLVLRKTDGNDANPDGGIAFMMTNMNDENNTILKLDGYGLANFTNYSILTTANVTANDVYVNGTNVCLSNGTSCVYNTTEQMQDAFGSMIQNTSYIWLFYDDANAIFNATIDESTLNDTIDTRFASTTYNATSITTAYGTNESDNITYINILQDDRTYNVTEAAGAAPVLTIYINYTDVTDFNTVLLRYRYQGGSGHEIVYEIYNYDTAAWEGGYLIITDMTNLSTIVVYVLDVSEHIGAGADLGIVQTRFRHINSGISSHKFYLDYAVLIDGFSTLTTVDHDALSGRDEPDNHPWAMPIDASRNFTGEVNATGFWDDGAAVLSTTNGSWIVANVGNYSAQLNDSVGDCDAGYVCIGGIKQGNTTTEFNAWYNTVHNQHTNNTNSVTFLNLSIGTAPVTSTSNLTVQGNASVQGNFTASSNIHVGSCIYFANGGAICQV